jgi:hypothetical protein
MFYRLHRRINKSIVWLRGLFFAYAVLPCHRIFHLPLKNLHRFARRIPLIERREYSQNGEDGIIAAIFAMIGTTNRYFVEFGVEDGIECNARYLMKHKGWTGLLMDGSHENPALGLHKGFITAENIESLFVKYHVPTDFDLLSIDIDGNDFWVWKAIQNYHPRVVIMEYNACIPYTPAITIPYDPAFQWDKTDYYGASLSALVALSRGKGYTLVATDSCGVNAFFVQSNLVTSNFLSPPAEKLYHPAAFKGKPGNKHPPDPLKRAWIHVTSPG